VGVLNLEGLWTATRPEPLLAEIAELSPEKATARMQQIYLEALKPELVSLRIREIKGGRRHACGSVTPPRSGTACIRMLEAELDLLVIQGTVVSAEHVSKNGEPLNLNRFHPARVDIPVVVGGCAPIPRVAPHATGRAGVLVGVGPATLAPPRCARIGVPQATAIADAAGAGLAISRRPAFTASDRRRWDVARRRHRKGDRLRGGRSDDRVTARGGLTRRRSRLPLGHGHLHPTLPRAPG